MILRSNNICYRELGSLPLYRFCVVAQSSKVLSVACTREPNYSNRRRVLSLLQSNSCGGYKLLRKCFDAIKNPMRRGGGELELAYSALQAGATPLSIQHMH